jgi:DNA repair protein RadC
VREAAAAVLVAHSHPSGDPSPSAEDVEVTRRLIASSVLLGIPLLDHVIVVESGWHSLRASRPELGFGAEAQGTPWAPAPPT